MTNLLRKLALATGIGLASLLNTTQKVEAQTQVSTNVSVKNKYVAAPGFVLEEQPVVQSSINVSRNGIYGNLWSNINSKTGLSEIDYTLGYNRDFHGINVDASYNLFDLINLGDGRVNDNLHEIWLSLTKPGKISTSLSLFQNLSGGTFSNSKGNRTVLFLRHNNKIRSVPISLEGSFQYNNKYFIPKSDFSIAQASVSFPFSVKGISVTPSVRTTRALDKDNFQNSTDYGISLGYSFGGKK